MTSLLDRVEGGGEGGEGNRVRGRGKKDTERAGGADIGRIGERVRGEGHMLSVIVPKRVNPLPPPLDPIV